MTRTAGGCRQNHLKESKQVMSFSVVLRSVGLKLYFAITKKDAVRIKVVEEGCKIC